MTLTLVKDACAPMPVLALSPPVPQHSIAFFAPTNMSFSILIQSPQTEVQQVILFAREIHANGRQRLSQGLVHT